MNTKNIFSLIGIFILALVLSGCANNKFGKKYNKPFKHNTPLIKADVDNVSDKESKKIIQICIKHIEKVVEMVQEKAKEHQELAGFRSPDIKDKLEINDCQNDDHPGTNWIKYPFRLILFYPKNFELFHLLLLTLLQLYFF